MEQDLIETIRDEVKVLRKLYKAIGKSSREPPSPEKYQIWKSLEEKILYLDSLDPPQTLENLPGTKVKHGNVEYVIHGIPHGELDPEYALSLQVGRFVQKKIIELNNVSQGEEYICEEGFSRIFDLDTANEINDLRYSRKIDEIIPSIIPPLTIVLDRMEFWYYNKTKVKNEYTSQIKDIKSRIVEVLSNNGKMSLKDLRYLPKIRNLYKALDSAFPFVVVYWDGISWDGYLILKRDQYIAQYSREIAMKKNLRVLHIITGAGHEPGIEKFLQYPAYTPFQDIEKAIKVFY